MKKAIWIGLTVAAFGLASWMLAQSCGCLGFSPSGSEVGGEESAPLDPSCAGIDSAYLAWTAVGSAASGLAGAAGGALAIWPDPTREESIGLGVSAAVLGVLGTTAQLLAGSYAQRWNERCSGGELP